MSFLKNILNIVTENRDIKEPVIYKEFNDKSPFLDGLNHLLNSNDPAVDVKKVTHHLKTFSIGQTGESSVLFELKNSMLPMVILHDVTIEYDNYKAQMDFVIITHKFILVLEVKKLFGNIEVTDKGEFLRVITKNNRIVNKEGMYSPINQVERHVAILEKLLKSKEVIDKCPIRYAVTFANHKTIINMSKNAPQHIKDTIIRHDQIKTFLKSELDKKSPTFMLDKYLYSIADAVKAHALDIPFNREDYLLSVASIKDDNVSTESTIVESELNVKEDLSHLLMAYRSKKAKQLNCKPYYIFNNHTLSELVSLKPTTINQLLEVTGMGHKKTEEFGVDIINIIKNNTALDSNTKTIDMDHLRSDLTQYRTVTAKKLNVKPFYIYTNKTLDCILELLPTNKDELFKVEGIGVKKAEEFGEGILEIVRRFKS
ncbi:HRDC domain-containing protein [Bacillus alkalisoli]|uniref:HRDC domain-containing protein n=1 Tax=Bacillus alkalisoli TaxID=2011008 RepID=UPI000C244643|nr:HRDC domain-containing protein [Bacillus alkalisoli]